MRVGKYALSSLNLFLKILTLSCACVKTSVDLDLGNAKSAFVLTKPLALAHTSLIRQASSRLRDPEFGPFQHAWKKGYCRDKYLSLQAVSGQRAFHHGPH